MRKKTAFIFSFLSKHKIKIILLALLTAHIFFLFYQLPERTNLGWDQADSAWASYNILVNKNILIEGVPIKGNASMAMGPLYYYFIAPFYFFTNFDPIASSIFAGVIGIISFFIFYHITKRIFGTDIALIALFIYTFSIIVINFERTQAAFTLIPIISYIVFYFLYRITTGSEKFLPYLAAIVGFGFHVHFTSVFYPILVLLAVPLFPRSRKTIYYMLLALVILLIFMAPMLYAIFFGNSGSSNFSAYFSTYFHGLHLRRFLQISHDAFISIEKLLQFRVFRPLVFFVIPIFIGIYYFSKPNKKRLALSYLMILWILVPWLLFATYSGELTSYYFSMPRYFSIGVLGFLIVFLYKRKILAAKLLAIAILIIYATYNFNLFLKTPNGNYLGLKAGVKESIVEDRIIPFKDRDPESYMYHIYKKQSENKN